MNLTSLVFFVFSLQVSRHFLSRRDLSQHTEKISVHLRTTAMCEGSRFATTRILTRSRPADENSWMAQVFLCCCNVYNCWGRQQLLRQGINGLSMTPNDSCVVYAQLRWVGWSSNTVSRGLGQEFRSPATVSLCVVTKRTHVNFAGIGDTHSVLCGCEVHISVPDISIPRCMSFFVVGDAMFIPLTAKPGDIHQAETGQSKDRLAISWQMYLLEW